MECDICFESYNRSEKLPKILKHCGHTFCESCIGKLSKGKKGAKVSTITCPACRHEQYITDSDYPVSNYALLVAMEEIADERQGKGISRYYRPRYRVSKQLAQTDDPTPRQIPEFIKRKSDPLHLRMITIFEDGEVIYQ